jgi:hypothetical protein
MKVPRPLFWAITVALLASMGGAMRTSSMEESQSWDEAIHLAAGYVYWQTGDFRPNKEHPPLIKLFCALPLLRMNPQAPPLQQAVEHEYDAGFDFLYKNRIEPDVLLQAARIPAMLLTLAIGLGIAVAARHWFGDLAGLLALFFFTTDPNLIAHGRYITTDVPAAAFYFAACALWFRYFQTRRWTWWAAASLALGCALLTKFSLIVLPGVLLLLALLVAPRLRAVAMLALGCIAALGIVAAVYRDPGVWIDGVKYVLEHNDGGHQTYLLGQIAQHGSWLYFPVAFAVKTPLALLLALPVCAWFAVRRRNPAVAAMVIPALVFFGLAMTSKLNLGQRHILPVYPFLMVLAGAGVAALSNRGKWIAIPALAAIQIVEAVRIHPDYTAFFNTAAGGPAAGPRYLLDSNNDWGQDMKKLGRYLDKLGDKHVCIAYFGTADSWKYNVGADYLPHTHETEKRKALDCIVAAGVTPLYGLYNEHPNDYSWLWDKPPDAKIGWTIYVWDMRKKK